MNQTTGVLKQTFAFLLVILAIYLYFISKAGLHQSFQCAMLGRCPPIVIEGTVAPKFEKIKSLFKKNYQDGEEISSCVVAYHKGEKIVDLCGGFADSGEPYRTALTNVYSSLKAICAVVIGMMVDRGLLSYEEKVSVYWPEFAQGGKENVTVSDLLTHSGGLAWLDEPLDLEQLADFDLVADRIAKQKHNFNSTRRQAYHSSTYGFALTELVRRTDPKKRTIGQFIREELNQVLGTEVYLGLTKEEAKLLEKRYTITHDASILRSMLRHILKGDLSMFSNMPDMTLLMKTIEAVRSKDQKTLEYFMVEIGAGNSLTNAESLARIAAAMAQQGTFNSTTIMSRATFEKAMQQLPSEQDAIFKMNFTRTTGGFAQFNWNKDYPVYGWTGYGGSLINWDAEAQIGFGYVMNAGSPEIVGGRGGLLLAAIQDIVYSSQP